MDVGIVEQMESYGGRRKSGCHYVGSYFSNTQLRKITYLFAYATKGWEDMATYHDARFT